MNALRQDVNHYNRPTPSQWITGAARASRQDENTSWPVSRVLYGTDASIGTWQPFIWDAVCTSPHATHPDDWPENRL